MGGLEKFTSLTETDPEFKMSKRHLMFHLFENLDRFGNPSVYAAWFDETLNRHLKAAARDISQATFDQSVLLRFPFILRDLFSRKRKGHP